MYIEAKHLQVTGRCIDFKNCYKSKHRFKCDGPWKYRLGDLS